MADSMPEKSLAMFQSLVNLYGSGAGTSRQDTQGALQKKDAQPEGAVRTADVVQLARRRIETSRPELGRQRERNLADLEERLAMAEKLAGSDVKEATNIYQAIIDLHSEDGWAAEVVAKARMRIAELKK